MISRDLKLTDWGPYSKHYGGFSKVIHESGYSMVDFIPLIGYDRGKIIIPDINYDTDYHALEASPGLDYIKYRFDLLKEEYAEVEFFEAPGGCLCRIRFVNQSDRGKTYVASLMSVLRRTEQVRLRLRDGVSWVGGESYESLESGCQQITWRRGDDYEGNNAVKQLHMGMDGLKPGVSVSPDLTEGVGVGNLPEKNESGGGYSNGTFVFTPGTVLTYRVNHPMNESYRVVLRFLSGRDTSLDLSLNGGGITSEGRIEPGLPVTCLDMGVFPANTETMTLTITGSETKGGDPSGVLDGFLILPLQIKAEEADGFFDTERILPEWNFYREEGEKGLGLVSSALKDDRFCLYSEDERPRPPMPYSDATVTHIHHHELSGTAILRKISNDSLFNWYHVNCHIKGNGENHFIGYNLGPFALEAGEERVVWTALTTGQDDLKTLKSRAVNLLESKDQISRDLLESYRKFCLGEPDTPYSFGMGLLRTCTLSNVTYPVRIGNEIVKTYTPGKRWGALFTWDSGMHGIGLNEYDSPRACDIHNQYLPRSANDPVPVVLHGTPLPLHVYLLNEIYQKTGDIPMLEFYYDRARHYWSYFAGVHRSSPYDQGNMGMLSSYADGYNSFGIDDYPIQHYEGVQGLYDRVKTVSITSHVIRTAKILVQLGRIIKKNTEELEERITYLSLGLQKYSWDEETGYFEHVDSLSRKPIRHPEGVSFNQGIDGVSPLVCGICNMAQEETLTGHLMSPKEMWTPSGITAVSQKAPYFRYDGYWNGKVWMPHQWFFWKAMISCARFSEARRIAETMLHVFCRSAEETLNSYELFDCRNGMGEGCHQFGGLSSPLAAIYHSYYKPGRWSLGFDTSLDELVTDDPCKGGRMVLSAQRTGAIRGIFCVRNGLILIANGEILPEREGVVEFDLAAQRAVLEWRHG